MPLLSCLTLTTLALLSTASELQSTGITPNTEIAPNTGTREPQTGTVRVWVAKHGGDVPGGEGSLHRKLAARMTGRGGFFRIESPNRMVHDPDASFERVSREGRFVYEAIVDDVPQTPGTEFWVKIGSAPLLDRGRARVRAGQTVTFFLVAEQDRGSALGLRVVDAVSDEPLEHYFLSPVTQSADFHLPERPLEDGFHGIASRPSELPEWVVEVDGYQRFYGDGHAFRRTAPPQTGFWATVPLTPGIGIRLRATRSDGAPAAGIAVNFDGLLFRTDSKGTAYLASPNTRAQRRIDVPSARIIGGNLGEDGAFPLGFITELQVILE